jgi:hypothetical protein
MAIDIEAPGANEADLQRALSNLREFRGCRVERTSSLTGQNYTGGATDLVFQAATLDTDSFWSAGTPARVTIPSSKGFTVADVSASVRLDSNTPDTWGQIVLQHYNSSNVFQRQAGSKTETGSGGATVTYYFNVALLACPVADGDYFVIRPQVESDTDVTINSGGTGITVNIIGMNPA